MSNPFPTEDNALDSAIAAVYDTLSMMSAHEEDYQKAVDQLVKLYKLKNDALLNHQATTEFELKHQLEQDKNTWQEEQDQRPFIRRVDPNVALTVAGNLFIGLAVIKYEQAGVIGTKVMSFIKKV